MKRTLPFDDEKQLLQQVRLENALLDDFGLPKRDVELREGAVEQAKFVEGVLPDELGVLLHLGSGKRFRHDVDGRGKPGRHVR